MTRRLLCRGERRSTPGVLPFLVLVVAGSLAFAAGSPDGAQTSITDADGDGDGLGIKLSRATVDPASDLGRSDALLFENVLDDEADRVAIAYDPTLSAGDLDLAIVETVGQPEDWDPIVVPNSEAGIRVRSIGSPPPPAVEALIASSFADPRVQAIVIVDEAIAG